MIPWLMISCWILVKNDSFFYRYRWKHRLRFNGLVQEGEVELNDHHKGKPSASSRPSTVVQWMLKILANFGTEGSGCFIFIAWLSVLFRMKDVGTLPNLVSFCLLSWISRIIIHQLNPVHKVHVYRHKILYVFVKLVQQTMSHSTMTCNVTLSQLFLQMLYYQKCFTYIC